MRIPQKNTSKSSRSSEFIRKPFFPGLRALTSGIILFIFCGILCGCKPSSSDSALYRAPVPQTSRQPEGRQTTTPASSPLPENSLAADETYEHHALSEEGKASWYGGRKFKKGHRTASGHSFDPDGYTAAHRFLPFGTTVRVFNLSNNKSVDVRINDRGPHSNGRIIDVSRQAAKELGMINDGVTKVRVEALSCKLDVSDTLAGEFWVQVNALFNEKELGHLQTKAHKTQKELKVKSAAKSKKQKSRLLIGPYIKLDDALKVASEMHQRYSSAFVIAN